MISKLCEIDHVKTKDKNDLSAKYLEVKDSMIVGRSKKKWEEFMRKDLEIAHKLPITVQFGKFPSCDKDQPL